MSKIMIPVTKDPLGQLVESPDREKAKDIKSRNKIVCRNNIKDKLKEIITLNKIINCTSLNDLPDYDELKQCEQKRSELIEQIWKLYCEANEIEYIEPKEDKKVIDMTAEELEALLKAVNANRPQVTQTMNFNGPVGQQIAHVDKIEAHFDKDMKMEIAGAEEAEVVGAVVAQDGKSSEEMAETITTPLSTEDQTLLDRILGYVDCGDWQQPATADNVRLFLSTMFGGDMAKLDDEDAEKTRLFRSFFKDGRAGKDTGRVEVSMANILGYLMRNQLLDGSPTRVSNDFFGSDKLVNNINKGKKGEASQAFNSLIPLMDKYRERIIHK